MKNFNDFLQFQNANLSKIIYDATRSNFYKEGITLTQADINVISEIVLSLTDSILRQYHEWLNSPQ